MFINQEVKDRILIKAVDMAKRDVLVDSLGGKPFGDLQISLDQDCQNIFMGLKFDDEPLLADKTVFIMGPIEEDEPA